MVVYQPPDGVLITVGAAFRVEPLTEAGQRLEPVVRADQSHLAPFGIDEDQLRSLKKLVAELKGMSQDRRLTKNDNPVQMTEVPETMARIRGWLATLRLIAGINLALDTPSLMRLASPAPELAEGYARDMLAELRTRLQAASDLKPRLEEVGLDDGFLGRGRKLAAQLATAIGKQDLDGSNLSLPLRRFYTRKAQLYLGLKRASRAGQLAFALAPRRAALYHLREIEPVCLEPAGKALRPKPRPSSS